MDEFDYVCFCRFLNNVEADLKNRIIDLERRYDIFRKADTLDLLELIEFKSNLAFFNEWSEKMLKLCDFLLNQKTPNSPPQDKP